MQSDIVQRLHRSELRIEQGINELCGEAAAEITRLTEALRTAEEREKALREALEPFALLEMEKDEWLADTQYVWETIYREHFQDWFSYEDISAARAALKGPSHDQ